MVPQFSILLECLVDDVSQPHEKFLLEPSRKFRFDKAWRNTKRSCGCREKIAID